MQNWEYNYLVFQLNQGGSIKDIIRLDALNQAGQQGWELVNVSPLGQNYLMYTFKRPAGAAAAQPFDQPAAKKNTPRANQPANQPAKKPGSLRDIQVDPQAQNPYQQQEQPQGLDLGDILNSILGGNGGKL